LRLSSTGSLRKISQGHYRHSADRHDEEAIEDEAIHPRVVAVG
jgi:hypothetical protein